MRVHTSVTHPPFLCTIRTRHIRTCNRYFHAGGPVKGTISCAHTHVCALKWEGKVDDWLGGAKLLVRVCVRACARVVCRRRVYGTSEASCWHAQMCPTKLARRRVSHARYYARIDNAEVVNAFPDHRAIYGPCRSLGSVAPRACATPSIARPKFEVRTRRSGAVLR